MRTKDQEGSHYAWLRWSMWRCECGDNESCYLLEMTHQIDTIIPSLQVRYEKYLTFEGRGLVVYIQQAVEGGISRYRA